MRYLITLLEGIISFISPCMLPMLPVYVSYFAGGNGDGKGTFVRALAFVIGFGIVFSVMGAFAGTLGVLLSKYKTAVEIVSGAVVVLLGLGYLGILPLTFLKGMNGSHRIGSVLSALVFGMVYAVNLTPCVGAFLGSALMLAANAGGTFTGLTLLAVYAAGLGIPFLISAVLIGRLSGVFAFVKRHYGLIDRVCGIFLIAVGVLMAAGILDRLMYGI